jgi:hypothetical protein
VVALEKAKQEKEAYGGFDSECPGYCGAQDPFYVGTLKGVGRISQQSFLDTYSKVAFAKLYDRKTPLIAADLLNDRVLPSSPSTRSRSPGSLPTEAQSIAAIPSTTPMSSIWRSRIIDHTRTKTKSPQTNGICELP